MRDPYWSAAWAAVAPYLTPDDCLLVPPGEWPATRCRSRTYTDRIELQDASVLFLHKGKIGCIRKALLRHIIVAWRCVFANEVFVCLLKGRGKAPGEAVPGQEHLGRIRQYFRARNRKRIRETLFFVHLPKAAGTSVWNFLSERVPSHIYYDTLESFLYNPPQRGEYDLVGGHVPLPIMAPFIGPDDHIVAVLREPTARFRSAYLHSRRQSEDPATFSPVMRAMREAPFAQFLASFDGQTELRQQLIMLGLGLSEDYSGGVEDEIYRRAVAWARDPRSLFRTVEQLDDLMSRLCALLRTPPCDGRLQMTNVSGPAAADDGLAEFEAHRAEIEAGNAVERLLYAMVERGQVK